MQLTAHYLPYRDTHRFSPIVLDYLDGNERLKNYYPFNCDGAGIKTSIAARSTFRTDRTTLTEVLRGQYRHLPQEPAVEKAIASLVDERTYTICTAHQPNLATGYLYFVYKILHAIKLSHALNVQYPELHFVPVYYMGSEDADLDELGTFGFGGKKFVWNAGGQHGAVGRMNTATLSDLLSELISMFGPPGPNRNELTRMLQNAYLGNDTVANATRSLVHALFGRYGLVVLDADNAALKQQFIPVMEEELMCQSAERRVRQTMESLSADGYKPQAHPRAINLFYLKDDLRERIEKVADDRWQVVGEGISWNPATLRAELHAHPERFSPNVILRPLYQETILPNIVFIGGGAEVSYWLQLRALFEHHDVFYPVVLLRQSVVWIDERSAELRRKLALDFSRLFAAPDEAARAYTLEHAPEAISADKELRMLDMLCQSLKEKATRIDKTLERSADAAFHKMQRQLTVLEGKMLRAEKRRQSVSLAQLHKLQSALFPGAGLAERSDNFMPYFLKHGYLFFDQLLDAIEPQRNAFLILEETA